MLGAIGVGVAVCMEGISISLDEHLELSRAEFGHELLV